jgi:hypothetical protein
VNQRREAKEELHESIQSFGQGQPELEGGVLVRAVIVSEWALPSGLALYRVSTGADGRELRSWEVAGLLASTLAQVFQRDSSEPV